MNILDTALDALHKGIVPVPCYPLSKVPSERWKRWQNELPPEELVRLWFRDPRANIAVICTGAVCFDVDDPRLLELVIQASGDTPEKVRTPSGGIHLPFRARKGVKLHNQVRVLRTPANPDGVPIDVRTDGGLRLLPPSRTADGSYEWIDGGLHAVADLPVAKIGWTRTRVRKVVMPVGPIDEADAMVRRARSYLAHIEGAISGQRGHDKTMRVAGVLVQKFRLTIDQAWPLFLEWNAQCEPPWSEAELRHKLEDAYRLRNDPRALR